MAANIQQHHQAKQARPLSWHESLKKVHTLNNFNMQSKNGGLEDTVPFKVPKSVLVFRGVFQKRHHFTPSLSSDVENFVNGGHL